MTVERGLSTVMLLACALAPTVVRGQQPPPWAGHLEAANIELARGDVGGAVAAWHEGYGIALRSRTWQGLVETADAYLQIAEAGSFRASAKSMARQIYLNALTRAKAQRSVEGALRVATAFDALGDREVVDHCVKVAEGVARRQRDGAAMEQVAAARSRFAQQMIRPRAARPCASGALERVEVARSATGSPG